MKEIERLKEEILRSYPRLSEQSRFTFACAPGVPCFNDCCGDVNIFLTPYDVVRLKNGLGMSSGEFLSRYTVSPFDEDFRYPVILLAMNEDDRKSCPFVGEDGCRVYADRPAACRVYPLGMASPKGGSGSPSEDFYFVFEEGGCRGFEEEKTQTVAEWLADQGIDEYNRMGEYFKELTLHEFFHRGNGLSPQKAEMFFLACYDLDGFRDFLFESTFFEKFEVDPERRERLAEDDAELLRFGHDWLMFALFGEKTLEFNRSVLEARKG
jgi:Fe-S-cluster containining protein